MSHFVFDFAEGDRDQKDLLGGKGANLAEMTRLGIPVPPGFTISTLACREYLRSGVVPDGLMMEVADHLAKLESRMGRRLGDPDDPLLVSVRSGAKFSMPGMMDTVLDIGLNDRSVLGLARQSHDERFAFDCYRRLLQMFGSTVLGVPEGVFARDLDDLKEARGVEADTDLDAEDLAKLAQAFNDAIARHTGAPFPQDPQVQLHLAVQAVFHSWNTERAVLYRRQENIPDDIGTAVNVQAMVFGNRDARSGSGVCFTRDPATGRAGVYGDYLPTAQGEDVVAGVRDPVPLTALERIDPTSYRELLAVLDLLERHYRDLCDVEFTIESGTLWVLQTRVGKRTPAAAFRIAASLVEEGRIDRDEALRRVRGAQLARLLVPSFDPGAERTLLTKGIDASPGAAIGQIALDAATAAAWAADGQEVILVRTETKPDDLAGMVAARGILTSRGGRTSHAAVVARGMGRPCVCGASDLHVDDAERRVVLPDGVSLAEGEVLSIDGSTGEVFAGEVPVVEAPLLRWFRGEDVEDDLVSAVALVMEHADRRRRLRVRANADTPADAALARRLGAEGIGLCRTEHMFLGERRRLVEQLITASDDASRETALAALLPLQRADFAGILKAMDGAPVTIRLIDPPLHEFLPDLTELALQVALAEERGHPDADGQRLLDAVRRLHEENPMMGLRGVRLDFVVPGLFEMQTRAILEAAADRIEEGGDPRPEVMVPLVAAARELEVVRSELSALAQQIEAERRFAIPHAIGTMIEVPRAALTADRIAQAADFFSFGTNDLTQMTWGFSRDDVEAAFFAEYRDAGVFRTSPFDSVDVDGVGELVRMALEKARAVKPELHAGVCGEHGGDPASIHFFQEVGVDYVSCSPFRIPVARLEAGRAALAADP